LVIAFFNHATLGYKGLVEGFPKKFHEFSKFHHVFYFIQEMVPEKAPF